MLPSQFNCPGCNSNGDNAKFQLNNLSGGSVRVHSLNLTFGRCARTPRPMGDGGGGTPLPGVGIGVSLIVALSRPESMRDPLPRRHAVGCTALAPPQMSQSEEQPWSHLVHPRRGIAIVDVGPHTHTRTRLPVHWFIESKPMH